MYIWETMEWFSTSPPTTAAVGCMRLLLTNRRALWCAKRRGERGTEERERESLTSFHVPLSLPPSLPMLPSCFALKQARRISKDCHKRRVSTEDWIGNSGAGIKGFCFIFCFFSKLRGAVSNYRHNNREDKDKSQASIRSSENSVFRLQAAEIYRSLLLLQLKHMDAL